MVLDREARQGLPSGTPIDRGSALAGAAGGAGAVQVEPTGVQGEARAAGGSMAELAEQVRAALEVSDAAAAGADEVRVRRNVRVEADGVGECQRRDEAAATHRIERGIHGGQAHGGKFSTHSFVYLGSGGVLSIQHF